jgi:hypothetical protein
MRAKHEIRQIDDERTRETNPTIQRDLELSQNEIKKRLELLLQDEIRLKDLTRHAQGTAIAFFRGNPPEFLNYSQVKNETGEILQTAKKAWIKKGEKRAYEDLEREFTKSHIVFEVIRELTAQNPETQLIRMEDINARVRQAEQ